MMNLHFAAPMFFFLEWIGVTFMYLRYSFLIIHMINEIIRKMDMMGRKGWPEFFEVSEVFGGGLWKGGERIRAGGVKLGGNIRIFGIFGVFVRGLNLENSFIEEMERGSLFGFGFGVQWRN
jgi:hypothetical protein